MRLRIVLKAFGTLCDLILVTGPFEVKYSLHNLVALEVKYQTRLHLHISTDCNTMTTRVSRKF